MNTGISGEYWHQEAGINGLEVPFPEESVCQLLDEERMKPAGDFPCFDTWVQCSLRVMMLLVAVIFQVFFLKLGV